MGEVINMRERKIMRDFDVAEYQESTERLPIPGLELNEIIEAMSPEERREEKQRLLDEINDREKLVWLINEVNEVEGYDMATGVE